MPRLSRKKIFLFGFLAVLLLAIPLTVFVVQQQQETRTRAEAATILQLCPPDDTNCPPLQPPFGAITSQTVKKGDEVAVDVKVNTQTNSLTALNFVVKYDPEFLALKEGGFEQNATSGFVVIPGSEDATSEGVVSVQMEINAANPTPGISGVQKLGTITFIASEVTATEEDPEKATRVDFDQSLSDARSSDSSSEGNEPVIKSALGTDIIIEASEEETPEEEPSEKDTSQTPEGGGTDENASANEPPVCDSFTADKEASTSAPFLVTFTAEGSDSDGIVDKVSLSFGDGDAKDLTETGGIGEDSAVSAQLSHTYQNAGTFTASATFTDNDGAVSDSASCSKTISISQDSGSIATPTATPTPLPTLPPTGPNDTLVGIGILGAILTVLGAVIFLIL